MIRQGNNYKGKELKAKLVFLRFNWWAAGMGHCGKASSLLLMDKSQCFCLFSFSFPSCLMIIELLILFS